MSGAAQAATQYTVGTLADGGTASDCTTATNTDCSLRRAIEVANFNAGADTVVFRSGLTGSIILTGGQIVINDSVGIHGPGASQLAVSGYGLSRIFSIDVGTSNDPASISRLTLRNGFVSGDGAAIYNYDSTLTISNSVIRDSSAGGAGVTGGGVFTKYGALAITNSTISGNGSYFGGGVGTSKGNVTITGSTLNKNTAYGDTSSSYNNAYGGALWMGNADTTIRSSTLDHNTATDGGGVYASNQSTGGGSLKVINSTIADNNARDDGGGIWMCCANGGQALTVTGSTVVGNAAVQGEGGIEAFPASNPILRNSIISGNDPGSGSAGTADLDSEDNAFQTSFSLIGVPGGYVTESVAGSNLIGVAPQLGVLANNGGPTRTELPASTSPVVNKGRSFGLTTDQRDLTRPVEFPSVANSTAAGADGADMGAVELQLPTPTPPPSPAPVTPTTHKKKCKKHKKHKRSAQSAKKKKCKKKKKK
jgi:hypothetical protein